MLSENIRQKSLTVLLLMLILLCFQTFVYAEDINNGSLDLITIENGIIYGTSSDDSFLCVKGSGDGNFIVVGYTQGAGEVFGSAYSRGGRDAIILKVDRKMKVIEKATFGGAGDDCFNAVTPLPDGSFIAVGYAGKESFGTGDLKSVTGNGGQDAIIVKFNKDLKLSDVVSYGGKGDNDKFSSVLYRDKNSFFVAGTKDVGETGQQEVQTGVLVQYDFKLKQLTNVSIGGKGLVEINAIINGENGDILAVGDADVDAFSAGKYLNGLQSKGKKDGLIIKYNPEIKSITAFNVGGAGDDSFSAIARLKNGDLVAVGQSAYDSFGTGDWDYNADYGFGSIDAVAVKFDSKLNIVDNINFGGNATDKYLGVFALDDGGFISVGYSENASFAQNDTLGEWKSIDGLGGEDLVVNRYDKSLKLTAINRFGGELDDEASNIEYFQDGGLIVSGFSSSKSSKKNGLLYYLIPQKDEIKPAFIDKLTFFDVESLDSELNKKLDEYAVQVEKMTKSMQNGVSIVKYLGELEKTYSEIIPLFTKRNEFEVRNAKTNKAIDRIADAVNAALERALEIEDKDKVQRIALLASESVMEMYILTDNLVYCRNLAIKIEGLLIAGLGTFEIQNYTVEGKFQVFEAGINDENEIEQMLTNLQKVINEMNNSYEKRNIKYKMTTTFRIKANSIMNADGVKVKLSPRIIDAAVKNGIDRLLFDLTNVQLRLSPEDLKGSLKKAEISFVKITSTNILAKPGLEKDWFESYAIYAYKDLEKVANITRNPIISIKCFLKEGIDTDIITTYSLADNGAMQNIGGVFDKEVGKMCFESSTLGVFIIKKNVVSFKDVFDTSWAKRNIETMASKGIVKGMENGNFEESRFVSRAEFVTMMVNLLKIKLSNKASRFIDVGDGDWFKVYVVTASENGIISSTAETFNPRNPITRQEMATIMGNVFIKTNQGMILKDEDFFLNKYVDKADIEEFAKASIAVMSAYSIMNGRTEETFLPLEKVMRKEAATALYNMMRIMRK